MVFIHLKNNFFHKFHSMLLTNESLNVIFFSFLLLIHNKNDKKSACKNLKSIFSLFIAFSANFQFILALLTHAQVATILQNKIAQFQMTTKTNSRLYIQFIVILNWVIFSDFFFSIKCVKLFQEKPDTKCNSEDKNVFLKV